MGLEKGGHGTKVFLDLYHARCEVLHLFLKRLSIILSIVIIEPLSSLA
jgi:hypothetical protein